MDPFPKALSHAYRLLAQRVRSESEIRRRLKDKGYDSKCIDEAIEDLKKKRLIDDVRFVEEWIEDRTAYRPKGALAIKDELLKKGVEEGIIDAALKDTKIGYNEYAVARALVDKKSESLEKLNRIKRKKRIHDYLARRGFSFDIIYDIIDKI